MRAPHGPFLLPLVFPLLYLACSGTGPPAEPGEAEATEESEAGPLAGHEVRPELERHFHRYGARGVFVLHDPAAGRRVRSDAELAARRLIPASTFKIFHSLVALETGAVADAEEVIPWDGVDRGSRVWNQDQTLRTAFQRSAAWAFQTLARRIGEERMRTWLRRVDYGNAEVGGGIDRFWLDGALRISADEQVEFLRRLDAGELSFSPRTVAIVRDIMTLEEMPEYTLRGKSGWARPEGEGGLQIGWLVGWVERGPERHYFALELETDDPKFPMREARHEILHDILRELNVLPARG